MALLQLKRVEFDLEFVKDKSILWQDFFWFLDRSLLILFQNVGTTSLQIVQMHLSYL
jgi:hypothetical protein